MDCATYQDDSPAPQPMPQTPSLQASSLHCHSPSIDALQHLLSPSQPQPSTPSPVAIPSVTSRQIHTLLLLVDQWQRDRFSLAQRILDLRDDLSSLRTRLQQAYASLQKLKALSEDQPRRRTSKPPHNPLDPVSTLESKLLQVHQYISSLEQSREEWRFRMEQSYAKIIREISNLQPI